MNGEQVEQKVDHVEGHSNESSRVPAEARAAALKARKDRFYDSEEAQIDAALEAALPAIHAEIRERCRDQQVLAEAACAMNAAYNNAAADVEQAQACIDTALDLALGEQHDD